MMWVLIFLFQYDPLEDALSTLKNVIDNEDSLLALFLYK